MKSLLAVLIAIILLSSSLYADYTVIALSKDKGVLIEHTGAIIVKTVNIQQLGDGPIVIDDPQNDRVKTYQREAEAVGDPTNAKKLAALFMGLVEQVETNTIKDRDRLQQVMTIGLDLFLSDPKAKAKWAPFRERLNLEWVASVQEGETLPQFTDLLRDVAAGLDASADSEEAISITKILQILQLIMSEEKLTLQTVLKILALILEL